MNELKKLNFNYIKSEKSNKAIVALHGWQGNKDSFLPLVKNPLFNDYNWFLLEGPYMVNDDPERRSWSYETEPNKWAYKEPKKIIETFFNEEVFKQFKSTEVYVIGFSLGALVCYEYICSMPQPFGGIFPISGFMKDDKMKLHPNQITTPIIIGHGNKDNVVLPTKSKEAYQFLREKKANVELINYDAQHNISVKMLTIIAQKIKNDT